MGQTVQIGELADAIMETLDEYADLAAEDVKQAVRDAGETVRKEIRANAPKDTGDYAKSWDGEENKRNFIQPDADRPFQKPLPAGPSAGVWPRKAGRRTGGGQSPYRPGGGEGDPAAGRRDRKEPEEWINFWIF